MSEDQRNSKTVRVSRELYDQAQRLSRQLRPKTTIQYVIEDALQDYLERISEQGPGYRTAEDKDCSSEKKGRSKAC